MKDLTKKILMAGAIVTPLLVGCSSHKIVQKAEAGCHTYEPFHKKSNYDSNKLYTEPRNKHYQKIKGRKN